MEPRERSWHLGERKKKEKVQRKGKGEKKRAELEFGMNDSRSFYLIL